MRRRREQPRIAPCSSSPLTNVGCRIVGDSPMFLSRRPSPKTIARFLEESGRLPLSYPRAGTCQPSSAEVRHRRDGRGDRQRRVRFRAREGGAHGVEHFASNGHASARRARRLKSEPRSPSSSTTSGCGRSTAAVSCISRRSMAWIDVRVRVRNSGQPRRAGPRNLRGVTESRVAGRDVAHARGIKAAGRAGAARIPRSANAPRAIQAGFG